MPSPIATPLEITALQNFKLAKGVTTYPVTLLWYPKMQDPDSLTVSPDAYAFGDASLLPAYVHRAIAIT
jgi:hypothetical protein